MTRELEELLDGMKVIPGNDANVAALGEMWKGGGKGHKNVIMVTLEPVLAVESSWMESAL